MKIHLAATAGSFAQSSELNPIQLIACAGAGANPKNCTCGAASPAAHVVSAGAKPLCAMAFSDRPGKNWLVNSVASLIHADVTTKPAPPFCSIVLLTMVKP